MGNFDEHLHLGKRVLHQCHPPPPIICELRVSFILYNNNNIGWLSFGLYENILHFQRMMSLATARVVYSHTTLSAIQYYTSTVLGSVTRNAFFMMQYCTSDE